MKRSAIKSLLTVMLLIFALLGIWHHGLHHKTAARLILYAGASFYLDINESGQVIRAAANNEAGAALLEKVKLQHLSLDTALDILGQALYESDSWKAGEAPLVAVSRLKGEEAAQMQTLVEAKMMSLREDYGGESLWPPSHKNDGYKTYLYSENAAPNEFLEQ